ncbi:HlyD family type I secretion periplasmic adaptor subunit [Sphingomonas sp. H39-1-10]|uniref:HlyD family type I secretion periplasmic adaptor subunit n=1 Tax=Sphingomonas pollutisoli TaxID=3030829 RepID=UPI0023B9F438|nr:HlyD family type I secretion periplasmic adaptor subunit [Sphingomonas pollutisoli]MDF0490296.1 HlyD family type I secretion periplasmic adaptor subunit [Sphingomonas pollutisoli]
MTKMDTEELQPRGRAWTQWREFLRGIGREPEGDGKPTVEELDREAKAEGETARRPARLGWLLLVLGFGGFVLWAAFAPLDNGVPMPGVVIVTGNRQAVEHQTGGIVSALNVREGDRVRAGEVLVKLDPTRAGAETQSVEIQLATARAKEARLLTERDGLAAPAFPADLERSRNADVTGALTLQRQLFTSRRAALQGELMGIEESIAGQRALIAGLEASIGDKRQQLVAMNEQLGNMRQLTSEGYVARNRLLETERLRSSIQSDISRDLGSIGQARGQAAQLQSSLKQRREAWQQDVRGDLADTRLEAQSLAAKQDSTRFELRHTEIRAPVSGLVVGLAAHTVGGVIPPGGRIMEIVPDAAPLIVEGHMSVDSIDKVHAGLPVDLLFTAFDRSSTPRLTGKVELISADRLEDEKNGQPYYTVRIRVGPDELVRLKLGDQPLRAGMPVEVFVRAGERTLLNYIFKPLFDRMRTAWGDK